MRYPRALPRYLGAHAQAYQVLSAQAATFHSQFVQALTAGANSYANTEAANASPLQTVQHDALNAINGAQPGADGTSTDW